MHRGSADGPCIHAQSSIGEYMAARWRCTALILCRDMLWFDRQVPNGASWSTKGTDGHAQSLTARDPASAQTLQRLCRFFFGAQCGSYATRISGIQCVWARTFLTEGKKENFLGLDICYANCRRLANSKRQLAVARRD